METNQRLRKRTLEKPIWSALSRPSPQQRVQVGDHPLQADPAIASRQTPHPVLEPGDGLVGDATAWRALLRQRKAEEGALPWVSHGALFRVDLELETPFDETCDACHHPPASRLA